MVGMVASEILLWRALLSVKFWMYIDTVIEGQHNVMLVDKMARNITQTEGIVAADTDQDAQGGMKANVNVVKGQVNSKVGYPSYEFNT